MCCQSHNEFRWNEIAAFCREMVMTTTSLPPEHTLPDEPEPSPEEIEAWQREAVLLDPDHEHATAEEFPRLWNISAGMIFKAILRAHEPDVPEYVTIPTSIPNFDRYLELSVAISNWNLMWEAAQFRRRIGWKQDDELPAPLERIAERGDINVVFVPRTKSRYYEYAPLYHLLSRRTVERHGLPLLRAGQWPFISEHGAIDKYLPADFEARLANAWAATVWRHLMPTPNSPLRGFTDREPIKLLAHNLDFWVPPVNGLIQDELRTLPTVSNGITEDEPVHLEDGTLIAASLANPRVGSDLWRGEAEAAEMVALTVERADENGRLRGILDAVRSNRVEDDFSDHWTWAREDFERKLFHKRSKISVRFVELTDTIPVQGPETEVIDRMVYGDFLALLNPRDRQIVILVHSGVTKLTDIADIMGYSNHSPISKRFNRIREQAAKLFEVN